MERKLVCFEAIDATNDDGLMTCVSSNESKLQVIRAASEKYKKEAEVYDVATVVIPEYEA